MIVRRVRVTLAHPRTLVRLTTAADELSVPRATVRSWASEPNPQISPIGLDIDGVNLYDLEEIRQLVATTSRRRRRRKNP